jgi:hypothetical protein
MGSDSSFPLCAQKIRIAVRFIKCHGQACPESVEWPVPSSVEGTHDLAMCDDFFYLGLKLF